MSSQIVLCVSHTLWLTREERYALNRGNEVKVIGASCPVWFNKGNTSEPASEVFCQYRISAGNEIRVRHTLSGYDITISDESKPPELPQFLWEMFTEDERTKAASQYHASALGTKALLDIKDGGSEWFCFRQYSKIKRQSQSIHLIHFVEIKDINTLEYSLA